MDGRADYGARYQAVLDAFGDNAIKANLCNDSAIASLVDTVGQRILVLSEEQQ